MTEKVTTMKLTVDLHCPSCYKKVKKILCKFPQIRDQVYDEKQNLVTVTVVCCSPEKIRDKLCCKGGKVITSIEIVEPGESQKPKPDDQKPPQSGKAKEKTIEPKPDDQKPPQSGKAKEKTIEPKPDDQKPPQSGKAKEKTIEPKPDDQKPPAAGKPEPCSHPPIPVVICCVLCSEGYRGGRCCCRNWRPVPPHACGCGCGSRYSHCDYFSEQNTADCTIM
ncbi:uncharacterized protein [Coffea arabica]|uniref:HMA domain-containing protein n=1 Tax=Coffea arabica TaxID=13443 RepID=A0ABM4VNV4_COFAR